MDLTEDIKKRWQEYTEELHKKDLNDPDNHEGEISHLEPDIQECEVKWVLGSITMKEAHVGDGILKQLSYFWNSWAISNPKRWCCESASLNMPANLENSAVTKGLEKVSFIPIPKNGNTKKCSNYSQLQSSHMLAK